tara:strand:+ start:1858 stop:2649 length:792 start_codon:yes stop_codon:yes gene_type:complete
MKKIAMIGLGAIGQYVYKNLKKSKIEINSVICKENREELVKQNLNSKIEIVHSIKDFKDLPYLIVDCAGHSALKEFAVESLSLGIHFITLSSGALADDKLFKEIQVSSKLGGGIFSIATGAVGSLDILSSAKQGGLKQVKYIGRKPPKGWLGSRAEDILDLKNLNNNCEVHFSGSAREAAKLYPKNANVAATIALAGVGLDKTQVKLLADNTISKNIHELEISGDFGKSFFKIEGLSLPDNPKSSALAAMSVVAEIKKFLDLE